MKIEQFKIHRIQALIFPLFVFTFLSDPVRILAQPTTLNLTTNGTVKTIVTDETTKRVYFGGDFTKVGKRQPFGAIIDATTGQLLPNFPEMNGPITTSYPDGSGGYFIGGSFTKAGNENRNYVAQINSSGQLTDWAKDLKLNGAVGSIIKAGGNVYLGGAFTGITLNTSGALLDIGTHEAIDPFPTFDGTINKSLADGQGGWYVGGDFSTAGGLPRKNLAHVTALGVVDDFFKDQFIDGPVNNLALSGSNIFAGGAFLRVNPIETSGAEIGPDGTVSSSFPKINGVISSSVPDGNGGWIIGGMFTQVGDQQRQAIARINSDGSVNSWYPQINNTVNALFVDGGVVYLGGYFDTVNGETRNYLAAVDLVTGNLLSWAPTTNGPVSKINSAASFIFVAGYFEFKSSVKFVVAIDKTDGSVDSWDFAIPNQPAPVSDLAVDNNTLYIAGSFSEIAGVSQIGVAAFDIPTKSKLSWDPTLDKAIINAVSVFGGNVYIAGYFSQIGGVSQNFVGCVSAATGLSTGWNPQVDGPVNQIYISGNSVFLGGSFTNIGNQSRHGFAEVSITTGIPSSLDLGPSDVINTISKSGSDLFVGGNFTMIGGAIHRNLAAFDKTTGVVTMWNPLVNAEVRAVTVNGTSVIVGGDFTMVNNATHNYVAELDITTGLASSWDPQSNSTIDAIAIDNTSVYLGGDFNQIGGSSRNFLASVDLITGAASSWDPAPNGVVQTITVSSGYIYVGGNFSSIGGHSTAFFAQLDLSGQTTDQFFGTSNPVQSITILNGTAIVCGQDNNSNGFINSIDLSTWQTNDWGIQSNSIVRTLSTDGTSLFAGGSFNEILGVKRNLVVLNATTGSLTDINPSADGSITSFALSGSALFVSGNFSQLGGQVRQLVGALDASTGAVLPWIMSVNCLTGGPVAAYGNKLFVAGNFESLDPHGSTYGVRAFDVSTGAALWDIATLQPSNNFYGATAIVSDGQKVYVGGAGFVELDANTGAPSFPQTNISVELGNQINSIALFNNRLYLLGFFHDYGGFIAPFDLPDEQLVNWSHPIDNAAFTISFSGNTIFLGGSFTGIDLAARNHAAALDGANGDLLNWNPDVNGTVEKLLLSNGKVLTGGTFTTVGGQPRNNIASIDATTGVVGSWNPNANNSVHEIKSLNGKVYVGGDFSTIGGQTRNFIACVDETTGLASTWNPSPNAGVYAIDISNNTVYFGGSFSSVGGQPRGTMASVGLTTGALNSFDPVPSDNFTSASIAISNHNFFVGNGVGVGAADPVTGAVRKLMITNFNGTAPVFGLVSFGQQTVAVGGFSNLDSHGADKLAIIDEANPVLPTVSAWPGSPPISGSVNAIARLGSSVFIGGSITSVKGIASGNIAVLPSPFQSMSFDPISLKALSDAPFALNATASSGLPVYYETSDPNVATISGNVVTITGQGTCTITAHQGGDATYYPTQGSQNLMVIAADPGQPGSLTFSNLTTTSMTVNWVAPAAAPSGYLVIAKEGVAPTSGPLDGQSFSTGDALGNAVVIAIGASTSTDFASLNAGTQYYFKIFSFNGSGVYRNYLTPGELSGNYFTLPLAPVLNGATSLGENSVSASWPVVNGASDYAIDVSTDNFVSFVAGYQNKPVGNNPSFTISGLSGGTNYQYRLRAVNSSGSSINSNVISILTLPSAPAAQSGTGANQNSFLASWTSVTSSTGYFLDLATDNGFTALVYNNRAIGNSLSLSITGLSAGTTYYYRVRGSNATGASGNSNTISVLTIPPDPIAVAALPITVESFQANWNASLGAADYSLDLSIDNFNTVLKSITNIGNATFVAVTDLEGGVTYQYKLRSSNTSGISDYSNIITVLTLPPPPVALPGGEPTQNSFAANWSSAVSATGYLLDVASSSDFVQTISKDLNVGNVTTRTVNGLTPGAHYYYRVRAINSTGNSPYSNTIQETTVSPTATVSHDILFPNGGTIIDYRIISFPQLQGTTLTTGLSESSFQKNWRIQHWDAGQNKNIDISDITKLSAGNGYWANSNLNPAPGIHVTGTNQPAEAALVLQPGWNQIGNPFYDFNISWADVLTQNSSVSGIGNLFTYNVPTVSASQPFQQYDGLITWGGGFVNNSNTSTVSLTIPVSVAHFNGRGASSSNNISSSNLSGEEWFVPITLQVGNYTNNLGGFGMHPQASPGIDRYDAIALPHFFTYVDLSTAHPEFFQPSFMRDVVPTSKNYDWVFSTASNSEDHEASLNWDNTSMGNGEAKLLLFDVTAGAIVDMRKVSTYSFQMDTDHSIKILFSSDGKLSPNSTNVGQPYPNPFTTQVIIPFITSDTNENIQLTLFDMMGKPVRVLVNTALEPGYHEATWDGSDDQGSRASSGIYIYQFTSSSASVKTGKIIFK